MSLIEALTTSHRFIRETGQRLLQSQDDQERSVLFDKYWQQFFAHEHAEERIAFNIMSKKVLTNAEFTDKALKFAVDEHHYFEHFVENITLLAPDNPQRFKLMEELVAQLDSHMHHEEAFVFPRLAEQLDVAQNQKLTQIYLEELHFQETNQTVSTLVGQA